IEFDRTVLDEIGDPLVHLLRNSVDHGVELPDEREKNGKLPEGTINLVARKEKTNAIIEVSDDGKGIDGERVKKSAIKKNVITEEEAEQLSEKDLKRLIFRPGMSTNENITEVSGRGVGMDVVETKIKNLGGNVKLDSELGKGTKIKLQLPLTLAIVNSLIVLIDDSKYALPLSTIERTVKIKKKDIKTIHGNPVFLLMNEDVPLICLSELLHGNPPKDIDTYTVIVVDKEDSKIGLVVDNILTQQQVLIKSLDEMVKGIKGLGGATILGDGKVAMIIDVATLFD
ncbi:MAG: chemotaxis protein CheA, partial [Nanoarchaeota archaeon]